jgi:hypothetical protein
MRTFATALIVSLATVLCSGAARAEPSLKVEGSRFVLETETKRLTSENLVGAVLEIADGQGGLMEIRIDAVTPAKERADLLLHELSIKGADGAWRPMCSADAHGRRAGFPLVGRWNGRAYSAEETSWFLTCTSGSQAKCALWGYGPFDKAPDGQPLTDFYRACQQMVRADYEGRGEPHTRNGTTIDIADVLGVQTHATAGDEAFAFEAGWGVDGAVCVARTRWPDLITREALLKSSPQLGGPCDEATAKARGALLFTRVKAN